MKRNVYTNANANAECEFYALPILRIEILILFSVIHALYIFVIAFEFPTSPFNCSVCMRFAHILHWFNDCNSSDNPQIPRSNRFWLECHEVSQTILAEEIYVHRLLLRELGKSGKKSCTKQMESEFTNTSNEVRSWLSRFRVQMEFYMNLGRNLIMKFRFCFDCLVCLICRVEKISAYTSPALFLSGFGAVFTHSI